MYFIDELFNSKESVSRIFRRASAVQTYIQKGKFDDSLDIV